MKKLKNFLLVSISTYFKRVLNLVLQVMLSTLFGTGRVMDAFFVAIAVPRFITDVLMVSSKNILIPKLIEVEKNENKKDFKVELFNNILFLTIAIAISVIIFSNRIISLVAPGIPEDIQIQSRYLLIAAAGLIVLEGLNHYLTSIFNAREEYVYISVLPIMSGIVTLALFYLLYNRFNLYALIIAWSMSYTIQLIIFYNALKKRFVFRNIKIRFKPFSSELIETVRLAWPLLLSAVFINIIPVFDKFFASFLPQGSISFLSYAEKLNMAIMVIPFSFMTIFLPDLAKSVVAGNKNVVKEKLQKSLINSLFVVVPVIVFIFYHSTTIVSLVLGYGKFDQYSVAQTGLALKFYVGSVLGYNLVVVSTNLLYSIKKTKIVAALYLAGAVFNIILAFGLSKILGFKGIALAFSISYALLAIAFIAFIHFFVIRLFQWEFIIHLTKVLLLGVFSLIFFHFSGPDTVPLHPDKIHVLLTFLFSLIKYSVFIVLLLYLLSFKKVHIFLKLHFQKSTID